MLDDKHLLTAIDITFKLQDTIDTLMAQIGELTSSLEGYRESLRELLEDYGEND